jgi:hypothetical protein
MGIKTFEGTCVDCNSRPVQHPTWGICNACYQARRYVEAPKYYPNGPIIKSVPTYHAAHVRVKYWRGSASAHRCVDCGKPASEWSYDYDSPYEQVGQIRATDPKTAPYSGDPSAYSPRCKPCHARFDYIRRSK